MAKLKKVFYCSSCGVESSKWFGRCTSCEEWGSCVEEVVSTSKNSVGSSNHNRGSLVASSEVQFITEIEGAEVTRISTSVNEFDRVLGGGLVLGSMVLLGGEPGIGKSTLALQVALHKQDFSVLYVSGEESAEQVRLRAQRLGIANTHCKVLCETCVEVILDKLHSEKPELVIVDSIQTLYSDTIDSFAGSVTQVRESAARLLRYAKSSGIPVILIGHITKEGSIAGPKILEHIVDVVFQFEGDGSSAYRLLRSIKNRYGSTSELGIFEMTSSGLREVPSASEVFLSGHTEPLSGIAMGIVVEGARPYILEAQALICPTSYTVAQRSSTGFDYKRMGMLTAVLEKRYGFKLQGRDIFLNLVGGFRIGDTGLDLAFIAAMISSAIDLPIDYSICFAGEVGLSGEVRSVARVAERVREAARAGFETIVVSQQSRTSLTEIKEELGNIKIEYITRISELKEILF